MEPFKTARPFVESPVSSPEPRETPDVVKGEPIGDKLKDMPTSEELKLEIWEGENKKKYVNEYFDIHELADEFEWKMPVSKIDKYIKELIAEKEYEPSIDNYRSVLAEIEGEIGSKNLILYKRIQKIASYVQVMRKLSDAKKARERFLSF